MPPADNNQPVQSENPQPAAPAAEQKQSFWSKLFGKKKDDSVALPPRESLTPPPQLDDTTDDLGAHSESADVDFNANAPTDATPNDSLGGGSGAESPAAGGVAGGEAPADSTLGGDTAVSGEAGDSDDSSNPPQTL